MNHWKLTEKERFYNSHGIRQGFELSAGDNMVTYGCLPASLTGDFYFLHFHYRLKVLKSFYFHRSMLQ